MKTRSQLQESIERFRQSFWCKSPMDRPPVGIVCNGSLLPINYLQKKFTGTELFPDDMTSELFLSDYEYFTVHRQVISDDWMQFSSAWRAVPWLEAMCGCPVRYASGSLAPGHCVESVEELLEVEMPSNRTWLDSLKRQTGDLVASAPDDCWISPTILRGPSDILAAMRGLTNFYLDLYDDINVVDEMASRVNRLFIDILDMHFSLVSPHYNGYGHTYGYWAPGRTIAIQEDAMGMCSPDVYRDVFMKYNADIVRKLGSYVLFHLHSTGYSHYRDVLQIPGIAGIEITVEENGPSLREMLPDLQEILEQSRLILFVHHFFEELQEILRHTPHEGLYILISDKFIKTEEEFRQFMKSNW